MTIVFVILIILVAVALGLIVLIQNPKGGGLAGNVAGLSNQFMGVKQTTDVLEKGTWIFGAALGILCILSVLFIGGKSSTNNNVDLKGVSAPVTPAPPANNQGGNGTMNLNPTPAPTNTTPAPAK